MDEITAGTARPAKPVSTVLESLATVGALAVTTIACCSWLVIQWLALALATLGGTAAFTYLSRFEHVFLAAIAVLLTLAGIVARDTWSRILDVALAGLALCLALLRTVREWQPTALWTAPPLNWLFIHRQQALFVAFTGALVVRLLLALLHRWQRSAQAACCAGSSAEAALLAGHHSHVSASEGGP